MTKLLFSLLLLLTSLGSNAIAANYYLAPNGNNGNDGSIGSPWASLANAAAMLKAGDTLYVRGGTYTDTTDAFVSVNSGSQGSPITITNYQDETPVFLTFGNGSYIIYLNSGDDYYVFKNLQFRPNDNTRSCAYPIEVYSQHNIFRNIVVAGQQMSSGAFNFTRIIKIWNDYNEVDNCTFSRGGQGTLDPHGNTGSCMEIYSDADYNSVHDSDFQYCTHHAISVRGNYNEIYDNTMSHTMGYGIMLFESTDKSDYNLVHGNKIKECDELLAYVKNPIYVAGSDDSIIRYNVGYDNEIYGISLSGGSGTATRNKIYNNVMWNNGSTGVHNWSSGNSNNIYLNNVFAKNMQSNKLCGAYYAEFVIGVSQDYTDQYVFNNFIVSHNQSSFVNDSACSVYDAGTFRTISYMENNYPSYWANNIYNYSDPKFNDSANGDFTLQSGSSLIDAGRWHTTTSGSGSGSTSLTVNHDMFWYSQHNATMGVPPGQTVGDQIAIGSTSQIRTIIGKSGNTYTLNSPATWSDGDPVTLAYSFSDHSTLLITGSAPDIGAREYPTGVPSPPSNLRIIQ